MTERIAVLFDAENVSADIAGPVLEQLRAMGTIQTRRAVGDFSGTLLTNWVDVARMHGIELVMQPSLGPGKNSADIALTIEAMELALGGKIDVIALASRDRDFAPLALRLAYYGLQVIGFSDAEPSMALRSACSRFHIIGIPARLVAPNGEAAPTVKSKPAMVQPAPAATLTLSRRECDLLMQTVTRACAGGAINPVVLNRAIVAEHPDLATRLSGNGKFLKTLVGHGIVERVGTGLGLKVRVKALRQAS